MPLSTLGHFVERKYPMWYVWLANIVGSWLGVYLFSMIIYGVCLMVRRFSGTRGSFISLRLRDRLLYVTVAAVPYFLLCSSTILSNTLPLMRPVVGLSCSAAVVFALWQKKQRLSLSESPSEQVTFVNKWFPVQSHCWINHRFLQMTSNSRFAEFIKQNAAKIEAKIQSAGSDPESEDKIKDVYTELLCACLMVTGNKLKLQYEPQSKGPDFFVTTDDGFSFYVEARHIRPIEIEKRWERWMRKVSDEVGRLPYRYSVTLRFVNITMPECGWSKFMEDLECSTESVVTYIKGQLVRGLNGKWVLPGFANLAVLVAPRRDGTDTHATFEVSTWPVMTKERNRGRQMEEKTQASSEKLTDVISDKLRQMQSGSANVLFLSIESATFWESDVQDALKTFEESERFRELSAIVARGLFGPYSQKRNWVWLNGQASYPLPDQLVRFLEQMDVTRPEADNDQS
jgi:hypothetical protein